MKQTYGKGYRWICLTMGTLAMVFCGVSYAWAILKTPLAAEFDWTPAQLALNHTLSMLFIAVGNLLAGKLVRIVPSQVLLFCSGVFLCSGFLISSTMTGNILVLYVSNAGLCGMGIGCFVVTIITVMGKWFNDRKGLSTSVLQMGLGIGGLIISLLVTALTEEAGMTWRAVYVLLGGLTGGVLSLAALIIREPASFVASFAGFILTVGGSFGLIYGGLCLLSFVSCILCYRLK
jgi:OFA family oxalate/formate antiporter-like MFS transporter